MKATLQVHPSAHQLSSPCMYELLVGTLRRTLCFKSLVLQRWRRGWGSAMKMSYLGFERTWIYINLESGSIYKKHLSCIYMQLIIASLKYYLFPYCRPNCNFYGLIPLVIFSIIFLSRIIKINIEPKYQSFMISILLILLSLITWYKKS